MGGWGASGEDCSSSSAPTAGLAAASEPMARFIEVLCAQVSDALTPPG